MRAEPIVAVSQVTEDQSTNGNDADAVADDGDDDVAASTNAESSFDTG